MYNLRYLLYLLIACVALGIVPASAQDQDGEPINLDFESGNVILKHEVQTTAQVEMMMGEQVYLLNVPVTIQIDDSMMLEAARISAPTSQIVGVFAVEPLGLELIEGEYEKQYRTVTPSDDEVVAIYRANVTNMHRETIQMGYTSNLDTMAIDSVGNTYEEEERLCEDINPGATVECEFIFKVPASAELVDLDLKAVAYKRFAFPAQEESAE